jgi:hypothetical protein
MITENTIVIVISSIECGLPVCVTGGWREKSSETGTSHSSEKSEKRGAYQPSSAPWNDGERSFSTKETVPQKYTPNQQVNKPYKAMETHKLLWSRSAPWLPVKLI